MIITLYDIENETILKGSFNYNNFYSMSKSSFYGITAVALVVAAGLVSVAGAKMEEQEYLSRALVVEAKVIGPVHGATSTASTTKSSKPDVGTDKAGIHNTDRKGSALKYKLVTGTVKSIGTGTFVLTARHTDFTVTAGTTTTRVYDRIWTAMPFAGIAIGDKVAAYGTLEGSSINARIVRDISKPVHTRGDDNEHDNATSTGRRGDGHDNATSTDRD